MCPERSDRETCLLEVNWITEVSTWSLSTSILGVVRVVVGQIQEEFSGLSH